MTTVDSAGWLDRLVQDIAHADANSLHAVRTSLAEVAGSDPDTAVASVVKQLSDVRQHLTAVARQVFAARVASAGPTCSSALAWATACGPLWWSWPVNRRPRPTYRAPGRYLGRLGWRLEQAW